MHKHPAFMKQDYVVGVPRGVLEVVQDSYHAHAVIGLHAEKFQHIDLMSGV